MLLEVRHLRKRYGPVVALDDVSFDVREREVLGLIGPNGAGKTTLFECLAGVLPRDGGAVTRTSAEAAPPDASPSFYVPDGIAPWPSQTVAWALDYAVGFFGGRADRRAAIVADLDLAPLLDVRIGALSKGQRKRALLGLGLLTVSPLLLIDEPFDSLDLRQARAVAALLRREAAGGRTMFLSIHQIADAARVCDRFVLLGAGRVRGEGTLDDLAAIAADRGHGAAGRNLEEIFLALT